MKILFYGETPVNETGAARVNRYLLDTIVAAGIEVEVLGGSHFFEDAYDHERFPYQITAIQREGEQETHEAAGQEIDRRAGSFDWLFISGDMHVPQILKEQVARYPSIVLGAIDGNVPFPQLVDSFELARVPAVYSRHAYNQVVKAIPDLAGKLRCIRLGCEPDVFYPLGEEERRAYRAKAFGIDDSTFLVIWANRNQQRKDPARALYAFHLFHQRVPNSRLYMHTKREDVGGNLVAQAQLLGMSREGLIFTPDEYNEIAGFSREKQNLLFNAADVAISTSRGEGWGLTTSELMAAGVPFIGPANTTFFEMMGRRPEEGSRRQWWFGSRGLLVRCGGHDLWDIFYGRDDSPRPLVSCEAMAEALYHVYEYRDGARSRAKAARKWTEFHTWFEFTDQWKTILQEVREHEDQPVTCDLADFAGGGGLLAVQEI